MRRLRAIVIRFVGVFRKDAAHDDLQAELQHHLAMHTEENIRAGMTEAEARRRAVMQLGGLARTREAYAERRSLPFVETCVQDLRYAWRILMRAPGFTAAAIMSLALGIGGTTAAYTLLDRVLLRPLPFPEPDRLVRLYQTQLANGYGHMETSGPNFHDWKTMSGSFQSMGAYASGPMNLSGLGEPIRVVGSAAGVDMFRTLGVQPSIGRGLTADDERDGAPAVVLLSDSLARALFATPAAAIGASLDLDDQSTTIVGVMPPGFAFPTQDVQIWNPLRSPYLDNDRSNLMLNVVARLAPGVGVEAARADLAVLAKRLEHDYPREDTGMGITADDVRGNLSTQSRMLVVVMFGASACLLLIACTNLATLLLGRATARRRELAVRLAIGAGRGRLIRQLLTESALLACAGGAVGVVAAMEAVPLLARLIPNTLPVGGEPHIDFRILVFALAITAATTLAFGAAFAWPSIARAEPAALRGRTSLAGRDGIRSALVVAQVAGTVTLLVLAGLLVRALWRVQAVDPGFRTDGVLTARTMLPMPKYSRVAARSPFYTRVLTDVRALPGVSSAAYISFLPMGSVGGIFSVGPPGIVPDAAATTRGGIRYITPGFFETLRIPIVRGRDVQESDASTAPYVTIVSESLVTRLWPGQDPIGQRINVAFADRTVVGVVGDIAVRGLERSSEPQIYFPAEQVPDQFLTFHAPKDLVIKTRDDASAAALAPAVVRIVHAADPEQPVSDVQLLRDITAGQTAPRRTQLLVLGLFAAVAFALAAVGIHGLLAFNVTSRLPEVGVRLALGARRGDVLWMFLRQGLVLGAFGVGVGIPLGYVLGHAVSGLLFGVAPGDPASYGGATLLAAAMILLGSLRPALQATRVDPAITMRAD
ncbi:MAG TPA: ABC transporter permease [Vicinamibacterales bacterium]|jgi:predicted permease|nr:ABC transporter permease [Vicinamibacterales bacterium]